VLRVSGNATYFVDGFEISEGLADNFSNPGLVARYSGAGVLVSGNCTMNMNNCVISNNEAQYAAPLRYYDASPSASGVVNLTNCFFTSNFATNQISGIDVWSTGTINMYNCALNFQLAGAFGILSARENGIVRASHCTFYSNLDGGSYFAHITNQGQVALHGCVYDYATLLPNTQFLSYSLGASPSSLTIRESNIKYWNLFVNSYQPALVNAITSNVMSGDPQLLFSIGTQPYWDQNLRISWSSAAKNLVSSAFPAFVAAMPMADTTLDYYQNDRLMGNNRDAGFFEVEDGPCPTAGFTLNYANGVVNLCPPNTTATIQLFEDEEGYIRSIQWGDPQSTLISSTFECNYTAPTMPSYVTYTIIDWCGSFSSGQVAMQHATDTVAFNPPYIYGTCDGQPIQLGLTALLANTSQMSLLNSWQWKAEIPGSGGNTYTIAPDNAFTISLESWFNGFDLYLTATEACGTKEVFFGKSYIEVLEAPTVTYDGTTLTATGGEYDSGIWIHDGNLVPGATSPTLVPTAIGNYRFDVSSASGRCSGMSNVVNVTTIGRAEAQANSLRIFPNPASTVLNVSLEGTAATAAELLDAQGRAVRTAQPAASTFSLSLEGLAPGLYTLRLATPQGTLAQRVIVQP
jgi:hypothetical protein